MSTDELTPRQREVALYMAGGFTKRQTAEKLGVTENTVKHHINEMFSRFRVVSAANLIAVLTVRGALSYVDLRVATSEREPRQRSAA